jgi:hypothetical protein
LYIRRSSTAPLKYGSASYCDRPIQFCVVSPSALTVLVMFAIEPTLSPSRYNSILFALLLTVIVTWCQPREEARRSNRTRSRRVVGGDGDAHRAGRTVVGTTDIDSCAVPEPRSRIRLPVAALARPVHPQCQRGLLQRADHRADRQFDVITGSVELQSAVELAGDPLRIAEDRAVIAVAAGVQGDGARAVVELPPADGVRLGGGRHMGPRLPETSERTESGDTVSCTCPILLTLLQAGFSTERCGN